MAVEYHQVVSGVIHINPHIDRTPVRVTRVIGAHGIALIKADIPIISANIRKIQMPCVTAVGVGPRRPVYPYVLYRGPGPGCILYDSIPLIR